MNSGMYAALSGNIASMTRLDVISNNLANANTPGFKRDQLTFESLLAGAAQPAAGGTDAPVMAEVKFATDFAPGPVSQTGNTFDLALEGEGFFVVETPDGKAYTRQGNFHRDAGGRLVTADGNPVLGGSPITITGGKVEIDPRGGVFVDGARVATLDIVDFPRPYALQKVGSTLFVPTDPQAVPEATTKTTVRQGALEGSNVSSILEMAQLIETSRFFESCQKVVRSYDDITAKAVNELGKV